MQNVKKILETNKNIDNKKQINDILGNGYWKIKIINMIKNPKLIIKNFKLFLNLIGFNFKFKDKFWDQ